MRSLNRSMLTCFVVSVIALYLGGCSSDGNGAPPAGNSSGQTVFTRDSFLSSRQISTAPPASSMTGTARVTLDTAASRITGTLLLSGVSSTVIAVHIHDGDVGVDGAVIVPLAETSAGSGVWTVSMVPPAGFDATKFKSGGYYLNVHTNANPNGEVRGQLISYSENIQPLFDTYCTGCHSFTGIARTTFLFLTSDQSYTGLVNMDTTQTTGDLRVIPFDHETSVLYERISGTGGFTGPAQMPQFGVTLSNRDQNLIKSWIMMGATNDGTAAPAQYAQFTRNAALTSGQTLSAPVTTGTGTARAVLDTISSRLTGTVVISGLTNTVTTVELRSGIIGTSGSLFAQLAETSAGSGIWTIPSGAPALPPSERLAFRKAGFHVVVNTAVNTNGEIRGQLMSYSGNIQPLFNNNCVVCHQIGGPSQFTNMWLNPGISYGLLVNVPATQPTLSTVPTGTRVVPFDSAGSVLYQRDSGIGLPLGATRMPPGGPFLPGSDTDMIKVWIDMGAAND